MCGVYVFCLFYLVCLLLNIVLIIKKFMKKIYLVMKMFIYENKYVDLIIIL